MKTTEVPLDKILEIVNEFEPKFSKSITLALNNITKETKDPKATTTVAKTALRYNKESASYFASSLATIAFYTNDSEATTAAAEMILKYDEKTAKVIINSLGQFAGITRDPKTIIKATGIISLDEIVKTVEGYYEKTAGDCTRLLDIVNDTMKDPKNRVTAAETILKYDREVTRGITCLLTIAGNTGDLEATMAAAKTIEKYKGETGYDISNLILSIASETEDAEATITTCNLINKVGSSLFDLLNINDIKKMHNKGLDKLVERQDDFDNIAVYLKTGGDLPLPTKDNIKDYNKVVAEHLSEEYGIQKEVKSNQLLILHSIYSGERKELAKFINNAYEKNRKTYSLYLGEEKELKIDEEKLPYHSLISVIGSRDTSNEKEAISVISAILGETAINRARNSFNSHYKHLRKDIISYVNNNEIAGALKLLKDTRDEAINDVVSAAEYRSLSSLKGKNILQAVESNNPLDYDSRVQIACVYLPYPYKKGIYNYCNDERFKLIRYDVNGNTIGSAICYLEDGNFLVDSVEGHRTFRKKEIFDAVYKDLASRAKEYGAKRIIFSIDGYNDTPNQFIKNLKKYGLKLRRIKMPLNTDGYLEADEKGVRGYIVDFTDKKRS